MKQKFWIPFVISVAMVCGILIGGVLNKSKTVSTNGEEKLLGVLRIISDNYVDEIEVDSLVEKALPALLENLDPHSSYIPAADLELVNSELDSKFSGIGISFRIINDTLTVLESISGGPSEKAGVLPGDRIIKVNDKNIANTSLSNEQVFSLLRGEKGTQVQITVKRRNSKEPIVFDLVRDDIPTESIDAVYMVDDKTGYIRVSKFARTTYDEFFQALNRLRLQGAEGFIIDLRDNGGGLMGEAIMMANEFLPPGRVIVSTRGRDSRMDDVVISDGSGAYRDYDVVVLINEFSASASEIFSGALQDNDRGWIIGRRSFGKGLVQKPITLPDSSEIRLTIQRYYTPSGRSIQKDYTDLAGYSAEIMHRYNHGELLSADSIKLNLDQKYFTTGGRTVYGGGGIMPDYFVPEDTSKVTSYYISAVNKGLISKFAYEYCDLNRDDLTKAKTIDALLKILPSNEVLLNSFVNYAKANGLPARWYYINISSPLIVNQIKAVIAQSILGRSAYFEISNQMDNNIEEALRYIKRPIHDEKEMRDE